MFRKYEYFLSGCGRIGKVTGDEAGYWKTFSRLRDAVACRQNWLRQQQSKEGYCSNSRPCNCGSGESWIHCAGIDGDYSFCG